MTRREYKHGDHSVLDHPIRRMFLVIEHEETYHKKREIYAWKFRNPPRREGQKLAAVNERKLSIRNPERWACSDANRHLARQKH